MKSWFFLVALMPFVSVAQISGDVQLKSKSPRNTDQRFSMSSHLALSTSQNKLGDTRFNLSDSLSPSAQSKRAKTACSLTVDDLFLNGFEGS